MIGPRLESPVEDWNQIGRQFGVSLFVKRDDLLPFPLAGNKVRKLSSEAAASGWNHGDVLISNGGVNSNHCRTLAFLAARMGLKAHLVLHGDPGSEGSLGPRLLAALGASFEVVASEQIADSVRLARKHWRARGRQVHVIPGGGHTPAGVAAYVDAGTHLLSEMPHVTHVVLASGTGATQAGLAVAAEGVESSPQVIGISVARDKDRGVAAIREAVSWVYGNVSEIRFYDEYVDGGYGRSSSKTRASVELAWRSGLPLDTTYTGKAMTGLISLVRDGVIPAGAEVLFWHTGGLFNQLDSAAWEIRAG